MTFSFQATVSEDAMNKVGRLFNASLDDILNLCGIKRLCSIGCRQ